MGATDFTELNAAAEALGDLRAFAAWDGQLLAGPEDQPEAEADRFDADTFTDNLSGACFGCQPVEFLQARERTAEDLADLSTAQVLALLVDCHQPPVTLRAAQEVLLNRCKGLA